MFERVILVDENDNEIGTDEKINAHKHAKLHRSFSIFVFNSKHELMIQKRASTKYHSPNLWSNTCCSHPRPRESLEQATLRKLKQEMGFTCKLKEKFTFIYNVPFDNGLTEHEFDHVFFGTFDGAPKPNPMEAERWKWVSLDDLQKDISKYPEKYTFWFKVSFPRVLKHIRHKIDNNTSHTEKFITTDK